ncbi:MAG: hypothetical protein JST92_11125 [Deltaproteobacteria bacterium]|nr:hypothetical protein [Deltaproteobacteria bacterium]
MRGALLAALCVTWPALGQSLPAGVKLGLSGFVQVDATLLDQASQDELDPASREPLNTERVDLRRAHLRLEARRSFLGAAFELDANTVAGPALRVIAAELNARLPSDDDSGSPLTMAAGLVRIPFGLETRELDPQRPFLEQASAPRALFPGSYQLGAVARGRWQWLEGELAVLSGEPSGAAAYALQAPQHALEFAGRGGIIVDVHPRVQLSAGLSGLEGAGFHAGTPTTKDQLVWRDANGDGIVQLPEIQVIPGTAAEPSGTFRRFALGADASVRVALPPCTVLLAGEAVWAKNLDRALYPADPVATGRDQRERGYSARLLVSELPLHTSLGVRVDRYDPDADASDANGAARVPFDASVSTWAFLASIRLEQALRLVVEYDRNHNAFGRGPDGAPASLASDALTLRAEVTF